MGRRRLVTAAAAALAALSLAAPAGAQAATAAVTISACAGDHMTVAGKVAPTGSAARQARGAKLQMRFEAMPLFGLPRTLAWKDYGKKGKASDQAVFAGLTAETWAGFVDWRFKKGSKTVLSGSERSQPVKVGASKGRANCTLAEGAKTADTTAPVLYIKPADDAWHHAPVSVQLLAQDDFSGVKSVEYSLDGGPATPIRNGSSFDIATEGAHSVTWSATDVAGNTASKTQVVKVDAAAPTKPVLSRPFSATVATTPTFTWSASTDSGSGLKGYFLAIKRADGSLVALQPINDPAATSAPSPQALNDGETYTATITAIDNTDTPFTSASDPLTFRVDTHPDAAASPAAGSLLTGSLKDSVVFSLLLDRNSGSTPSTTSVVLQRVDPTGSVSYTVGCNSPCNTITVDPQSSLPEGRYILKLNGLNTEEGVAFASPDARYAVPFLENGATASTSSSSVPCSATNTPGTTTAGSTPGISVSDSAEQATLDFDWTSSGSSGWSVQATWNGTAFGPSVTGNAGSGHAQLVFPLGSQSGTGTLAFKVTANCPATTSISISNLLGSRVP